MRPGVRERGGDPAERADAGPGTVGEACPARQVAPAHHQRVHMAAQRVGRVVDQPLATPLGERLVAAEAARGAAGDDRAEDQRAASIRTGTDLPAGTWLSLAWCASGISGLHSG